MITPSGSRPVLSILTQGSPQYNPLHGFRPKLPRGVSKIRHPIDKLRKPQTPIDLRLLPNDQKIHPLGDRSLPRPGALRVRLRPVRAADHDLRPLPTQHSTRVERDSRGCEGCCVCWDQIIGNFLEVGLPYIMRFIGRVQGGGATGGKAKGKRVDFQDEKSSVAESSTASGEERREERELLVRIRKDVALEREYDVFEDYLEMVTQFGYITIWSTIWPLAPVMALVNNYIELRSDAFKVSKHLRRSIPVRTDSIGPWLECLKNLTWIAALMNPALVYMFNPRYHGKVPDTQSILEWTALVALLASHEFLFTRWVVKFIVGRAFWRGSEEQLESEKVDRQVKDICLKSLKRDQVQASGFTKDEDTDEFWKQDEGLSEIQKVLKDA